MLGLCEEPVGSTEPPPLISSSDRARTMWSGSRISASISETQPMKD